MNEQALIQLVRSALELTLIIAGPILVVGLLVGLTISILQVVTSIQDATLSFVPRIVGMLLISLLMMAWMIEKLSSFTTHLFSQLPFFVG
ncbi:MAG: flagellar biosynthesis protein FliQ [Acidobacteriota bacterium]